MRWKARAPIPVPLAKDGLCNLRETHFSPASNHSVDPTTTSGSSLCRLSFNPAVSAALLRSSVSPCPRTVFLMSRVLAAFPYIPRFPWIQVARTVVLLHGACGLLVDMMAMASARNTHQRWAIARAQRRHLKWREGVEGGHLRQGRRYMCSLQFTPELAIRSWRTEPLALPALRPGERPVLPSASVLTQVRQGSESDGTIYMDCLLV